LVEQRVRHRSWTDLGIKFGGFWAGLRSNWWLFLLVVVLLQVTGIGLAKIFWPSVLTHVTGRIPAFGDLLTLVPLILVLTLREEMVFRGLFQERLGWFFGQVTSIAAVSVLFALTHIQPDASAVVGVDLLFVFLDSLVYGAIYARSGSVFVSWAAHAASDFVGLALLIWAAAG
jgi:membrane protease YdiL (CAAX protease family)